MKWFKHDTDAHSDAKLRKLLIRHGAVAYAVYFHCLELIASEVNELNFDFMLEHDAEIIADNLKVRPVGDKSGGEIVAEILQELVTLNLLEEKSGQLYCTKMLKRLDSSMTSSKSPMRKIIQQTKNHGSASENHGSTSKSHGSAMEDKKRKEEKRDNIPYEEIIGFLNQQVGRTYRASSKKTKECINARWKEGFRVPDFKLVILNRTGAWLSDKKMSEYLRPETLFGTKMEHYVELAKAEGKPTIKTANEESRKKMERLGKIELGDIL